MIAIPDIDAGTVYTTLALRTDAMFTAADKAIDKFNSLGTKGEAAASALNKSLNDVTGFAKYQTQLDKTTMKYDEQAKKVKELEAATAKYIAEMGGHDVTQEVTAYTALGKQTTEAKEKLAAYEIEMQKAAQAADVFRLSQQEAAVATAEQKIALIESKNAMSEANISQKEGMKDTTLAAGALSMGLRSISSVTGGAVSGLSDMAMQVVYLRRVMQQSAAGASAFTVGLTAVIGVATLVVTAIMKIVSAHNEQIEAQRKAAQQAGEYIRTAQEESFAIGSALAVLRDTASTTEDVASAKNSLAQLFPSLVTGWTNEGNAILANNDALEHQLELSTLQIQNARDKILQNALTAASDAETAAKRQSSAMQGYEDEKARYEELTGLAYDEAAAIEQIVYAYDEFGAATAVLADPATMFEKITAATSGAIDEANNLRTAISAQVQDSIEGYDEMSAAQQIVVNGKIAEATATNDLTALLAIINSGYKDVAASALLSATNGEILAGVKNQLVDATAAESTAETALIKARNDSITNLNKLSSAYATLSKGESLSMDNILSLISVYPQIAKYIAETGDLTLKNGQYLKEVAEISSQASRAQIQTAIATKEAEIIANNSRIEALNRLSSAYLGLSGAAMSAATAMATAAGVSLQGEIDALNAQLKAISSFKVTSGAGGGGGTKSSAYQRALSDFEYQRQINDWTEQAQLEHLEKINTQYRKSAEEQRTMDLKIKSLRDSIREAETEAELKAIQNRIDAVNDDYSHRKAMGESYLKSYIAGLETLIANEKLSAEQRRQIDEDLYAAKMEYVDKMIEADEFRLWNQHETGAAALASEIDMINNWLLYYELTDEQIVELIKRRYGLQEQLVETQKKDIAAALKSQQETVTETLNAQKQAWKDWASSIKDTINEYLKAIDQMQQEEDREAKRVEMNREISAVQLKIAYETDTSNIRALKKELTNLEKAKTETLSKWALEDTKAALNDLKNSIEDVSEAQQDAITKEIDRIKSATDIRQVSTQLTTGTANALMSQISASTDVALSAYAAEYKDVGIILGQSIEKGLTSALSSVIATFERLQSLQGSLSTQAASVATSAATGYETRQTTNNVNLGGLIVNFNQPIQSPYEVTAAIEEAGRKLLDGYYN